ncbi:hypothetical protein [Longimicrobium sp.]|uniref:hypothetical protein n=1 Tax=Longimicrobium sp. TaxID=2029185 RepID=UPI002EDB2666
MLCARPPRFRPLFVLLGLAANLIAAGTPLLHGVLHELHEVHEGRHVDEHAAGLVAEAGPAIDHSSADIHPQALHDDAKLVRRDVLVFTLPSLALASREPVQLEAEYFQSEPPGALRSRAPPPGDPARAPPHV